MVEEDKDFDGIRYRKEEASPRLFRLLLAVLVIWAVGFMAYYLTSGWSSEGEYARDRKAKDARRLAAPGVAPTAAAPKQDKAELLALGRKEFGERCAACHGADGRGGIGPDLTAGKYKYGKSVEAVTKTIGEGRPGGMPAFAIPKEKIEQLTTYVLSL